MFSILWVEDDPNDVFLGERAILKAGFQKPTVVRDGEQAVFYLDGQAQYADRVQFPLPSLLLLDLKLPKLSGFEVLRWIRGQTSLKLMPVIILTSSKERLDIHRAYELGANAYLVKPVESPVFAELFRSLHSFWVRFNTNPDFMAEPSRSPSR